MLDLTLTTLLDVDEVTAFLRVADLTLSGLDSSAVRLWTARDAETGCIVASTGYERSDDNEHVLIRSVAVDPALRGLGIGLQLARFALDRAAESGATRAWLFSRRSGPFWQAVCRSTTSGSKPLALTLGAKRTQSAHPGAVQQCVQSTSQSWPDGSRTTLSRRISPC